VRHDAPAPSGPVSGRPSPTRNSVPADLTRVRSRWVKAGPIAFPVSDYPRWRQAVVERYAGLHLRTACVPLTATWMQAYLEVSDVRPVLQRIAESGADPALVCCVIGFCAQHQAYFDRQGPALRALFTETFTLRRRTHLANELRSCVAQLQKLVDLGIVGFVNEWVVMRRDLVEQHRPRTRREYVGLAEAMPCLTRMAEFLGQEEIGWANIPDARYRLSHKRGPLPAIALDACIARLTTVLRRTGSPMSAIEAAVSTLVGPAFQHYMGPRAIRMRLQRRARREARPCCT
jgi:hypothetical protein